MNRLSACFLAVSAGCMVAGAWMLLPAAGVLVAGCAAAAAGVLSLDVGRR